MAPPSLVTDPAGETRSFSATPSPDSVARRAGILGRRDGEGNRGASPPRARLSATAGGYPAQDLDEAIDLVVRVVVHEPDAQHAA